MTDKKSTLEERMNDTKGVMMTDLLTPEQRQAYMNMSDEEAEKFEREVLNPLLDKHLK